MEQNVTNNDFFQVMENWDYFQVNILFLKVASAAFLPTLRYKWDFLHFLRCLQLDHRTQI